MCWSCGCNKLDASHGDSRALTTSDMQKAAAQAGTDVSHVVGNIVVALSQYGAPAAKAEFDTFNTAGCRVLKASDERRFTLGVAYPAMKADKGRAADGYRDFVSAEVLEKTAWDWLANHGTINLFHKAGDAFDGHGTVVESHIWRADPWTVRSPVDGSSYTVQKGDWILGVRWDDHGWELVKAGLVNGWSPEGSAARDLAPSQDRLAQLRSA